jgi:phage terminase Nu1 subunit (DNA packaging protein)
MMQNKTGVSMSAAATHCGISVVAFSRLLDMGVIQRQPREVGYDLTTCRLARFKHLENLAAGRGGIDGSSGAALSASRSRLAEAQTRAQEMKTAILSGEYVRLEVFARVLDEMFVVAREIALSTPGKTADAVAAACGGDRALVFRIIDDEIREMLTLLSTPDIIARGKGKQARRSDDVEAKELA